MYIIDKDFDFGYNYVLINLLALIFRANISAAMINNSADEGQSCLMPLVTLK